MIVGDGRRKASRQPLRVELEGSWELGVRRHKKSSDPSLEEPASSSLSRANKKVNEQEARRKTSVPPFVFEESVLKFLGKCSFFSLLCFLPSILVVCFDLNGLAFDMWNYQTKWQILTGRIDTALSSKKKIRPDLRACAPKSIFLSSVNRTSATSSR